MFDTRQAIEYHDGLYYCPWCRRRFRTMGYTIAKPDAFIAECPDCNFVGLELEE